MITITGGSLGYQIGVQSTDLDPGVPHAAECGERDARNAQGGRRCVGGGGTGGAAGIGGDRFATAGRNTFVLAGAWCVLGRVDRWLVDFDRPRDRCDVLPAARNDPRVGDAIVQLFTTLSGGGPPTVAPPTQQVVAVVPNRPPSGPPAVRGRRRRQPTAVRHCAHRPPPSKLEAARQQLDASSRQLAASLDDDWKKFLALPPEIYIPNHSPSVQSIEQAISRYEQVSEDPKFAALTQQPAFQATLSGLWKLGELQQGAEQKMRLPPPPLGAKAP